ncbi:MAG TPA: RNA-guided endonuclease IscB [Ktedonobacteraceae bacterium]
MSKVFVVDSKKRPLDPVHPGWARKLLSSGQAAVFRQYPFTIILKREIVNPTVQPLRLKIDPGSKTTGVAIVNDARGEVIWAAELTHRGQAIKQALDERRAVRRSGRQRKTRYRQPRFQNRRRPKGWLPPSLESRMTNVLTWTQRLMRFCPIASLSQELVKFDMQALDNPEISGAEYQGGTLAGYELREYLLEKWGRQCAYCGAKDVPLQVEHLLCRARGGSNRVSNLTLACEPCNHKKGTQLLDEFLKDTPHVPRKILAQAKAPLKDAAAVNTTRWALYERLKTFGLPVECGTGGRTKYNRLTRDLPKTHWIDAACVGASTPEQIHLTGVVPVLIAAEGRQSRQMCLMNSFGFPRTKPKQSRLSQGLQTGDLVKAIIPKGKYAGAHVGRIAIRSRPCFHLNGIDVHPKYLHLLYHNDGYSYRKGERAIPPAP